MAQAKEEKKKFMGMSEKDFSKENFIEGGVIRPAILMLSFVSFLIAMYLLLIGNLKWGGSAILFSFILNMYSIYQSIGYNPSDFKKMNFEFKFTLYIVEIIMFNWVLTLAL
mgnify:CR=1 FL=1